MYSLYGLPEEDCGGSSKDTRNTKEMPVAGGVGRDIRVVVGSVHETSKGKDKDEND